jgi:SAM-dependent methyltransferase
MAEQTLITAKRGAAAGRAYTERPCPHCAATETGGPSVFTTPAAEQIPIGDLIRQWNSDIFNSKAYFTYHRCASCGLLYAPRYPDDGQLAELYGSMPANMSELPASSLRRTQEGYARRVLKYAPPEGDYVEVGPDTGLLAATMRRSGTFHRFWFLEPNLVVHPELKEAVRPHEAVILTDLNDFGAIPDRTAGAAAMVHVLDHLTNPNHHLRELLRCLKPGGLLTIVVHNERSLLAKLFGTRHPIYCPYHPQLFNPVSLAGIVRSAGFDVLQVARTMNYYPMMFLLKNALFRAGLGLHGLPAAPWLCFPMPLGNIQLTARRP